jgi:hypothetical protein
MRWSVLSISLLVSSAAYASAEEPSLLQPYAPFKTVGIVPESRQVLFWDAGKRELRLVKLGDELEGWRLVSLDLDKAVVTQGGIRDELPLTPLPAIKLILAADKAQPVAVEVKPEPPKPIVVAEVKPPEPPKPTPPPAPERSITEQRQVVRADLTRELGDFERLLKNVTVTAAPGGGFVIVRLDSRSWVATMGIKQGDIIRSVAGERVSTVDDAARIYARLHVVKNFEIELERPLKDLEQKVTLKFDLN